MEVLNIPRRDTSRILLWERGTVTTRCDDGCLNDTHNELQRLSICVEEPAQQPISGCPVTAKKGLTLTERIPWQKCGNMLICTWWLCLSVQSSAEDRQPRTSAQRMPNRVVADSCLRHSIISSKHTLYKGNWKKRGLSQFLFHSVCSEGIIDFRSTHETIKFRCHIASFDCYAAYTSGAWELLTNSETVGDVRCENKELCDLHYWLRANQANKLCHVLSRSKKAHLPT